MPSKKMRLLVLEVATLTSTNFQMPEPPHSPHYLHFNVATTFISHLLELGP
jgi:hypothetical protein